MSAGEDQPLEPAEAAVPPPVGGRGATPPLSEADMTQSDERKASPPAAADLFRSDPPAHVPARAPRRTTQLPQTADRLSFHTTATATSSDGLSTVQVNRFGDIVDVRHFGSDPTTDSWVLKFAEIGKIMAQARWTWSVALAAMGRMSVAEHFGVTGLSVPLVAGRQPRAIAPKHDHPGGVELAFGAPKAPFGQDSLLSRPADRSAGRGQQANAEGRQHPFPALLFDVDCPDSGYPELLEKAQTWFFSGSQDDRVKAVVDAAGRAIAWYTRGDLSNIYTKAQLDTVVSHCLLLARREAQAWLVRHFAPLWQRYPTWLTSNTPVGNEWGPGADHIPEALIGSGWTQGSQHAFDSLAEFLAQPAGRWQPHSAKALGWASDPFRDFAVKQTVARTALDERLSLTVDSRGKVVAWSSDPDLLRWYTLGELEWMLTSMYLSACKEMQLILSGVARQTNLESGIRTLGLGLIDFSVHAPEFAQIRWGSAAPMRDDYRPLPDGEDPLADEFRLRVRVPGATRHAGDPPQFRARYLEASQVAVTCSDEPAALLAVSVGADCKPTEVRVGPAWRDRYAEEDVPWLLDRLYQSAVDFVLEAQIRILLPVWRTPERLVVDRDVPRLWFLTDLPAPFHQAPTVLLDT